MDCAQARWLFVTSLHGELDVESEALLQTHLARCEACQAMARLERRFEERLRSVPPAAPAAGLRARVQAQWRPAPQVRPRRLARLAPLAWGSAGALAASIAFLFWIPGLRVPVPRGPHQLVGTVVCLGCLLRPETIPRHTPDRGLDHVNGLLDRQGALWHLVDTGKPHDWRVSDALLTRTVRVEGFVDPASRSVLVRDLSPLESDSARSILLPASAGLLLPVAEVARRLPYNAMAPVHPHLEAQLLPDPR